MNNKWYGLAAVVSVMTFGAGNADAGFVTYVEQDLTVVVQPGAADFTGASYVGTRDYLLNTTAGSSTYNFAAGSGLASVGVAGLGQTTTTISSITPGTTGTIGYTSPGGSGQGFVITFARNASTSPAASLFTSLGGAGEKYLTVNSGATNVSGGFKFLYTLDILGDWTGRATLNSYTTTSGFSLLQSGVYDGTETVWQISSPSYIGGTNAFISVTLADVPEPAALSLFGAGLLGLAGIGRYRRPSV